MSQKTLATQVLFGRIQRMIWLCLFVAAFVSLTTFIEKPKPAIAATSNTMNFQARLLTSSGSVVPDGYYNAEFKLYNVASGGSALWTETYHDNNGATAGNDNRIRVVNGYLTVNLNALNNNWGSVTDWSEEMWLTMNIGGTAQIASPSWDGEMSPRLKLTAVPYAIEAANADKLGGIDADQYAQLGVGQIFSGTNAFQADSTTALQIQNAAGNSNLLVADTVNSKIGIGIIPDASGAALQVGVGGITTSGNIGATGGVSGSTVYAGLSYQTSMFPNTGFGTIGIGDVVIYDESASMYKTTTTPRDSRVAGVNTNNWLTMAISGMVPVNVDSAAIAVGDQLVTSVTAGRATVDNNATTGIIGRALTSKAAGLPGQVDVRLEITGGQYAPIFRNKTNSATAFQVQNASGASLLTADTINSTVNVQGGLNAGYATYSTGTISQSGGTVTGVGTNFDAAMRYGTLVYADGSTAIIEVVNSSTSLTVNVSKTVAAGTTYSIRYDGVSITNNGYLKVNAYGTEVFSAGGMSGSGLCANTNVCITGNDGGANKQAAAVRGAVTGNDAYFGGTSDFSAKITSSASNVGLVLQGASSQSADLLQAQNNSGQVVAKITAAGDINATGTISNNGIISGNQIVGSASIEMGSSDTTGVLIKKATVGSTGTSANDVVILTEESGAQKIVRTTSARDPKVYGVVSSAWSSGASPVNVAIGGNATINVDTGAVAVGDQLVTSTTAGRAMADNNATTGIIGTALTSKAAGSNGTVIVSINVHGGQSAPKFRNQTDSSAAFQVQNASGASLLNVDTTGSTAINIGKLGAFTDDFETGDMSKWTSATNLSASTDKSFSGTYSAKSNSVSSASYAQKTISPTGSIDMSARVNFANNNSTVLDFLMVGNGSQNFTVNRESSDYLCIYNGYVGGATCTDFVDDDTWYDIDFRMTKGNPGKLQLYVDNVLKLDLSANVGTADFTTVTIGNPLGGRTGTIYIDDVNVQTATNAATTLNLYGNLNSYASSNFNGQVTVKNSMTAGFVIQNASGTNNLFVADTVNGKVGIGTNPNAGGAALQVVGGLQLIESITPSWSAALEGSMMYDSSTNKFYVYDSTGKKELCNKTDASCGGNASTLQDAYAASSNPEITVDSTRGALTVRDASSAIGANLLEVQNNAGTINYLSVAANSTTVRNGTNSTSGFQVQNAAGSSVLNIDTTNNAIALNGTSGGSLKTWTDTTNTNLPSRYGHGSVIVNGYMYVVGGSGGSIESTVYYAKVNTDGTTGSWSTTTSINTALLYPGVVTSNGYIYVTGGATGTLGPSVNTVYYAKVNTDGTISSWKTNTSTGLPNRHSHGTSIMNGYMYITAGFDGTTPQSSVYYAKVNTDGSVGNWATTNNTNLIALSYTSSVASNGYIYLAGGRNTVGAAQSAVYYAKANADGTLGNWATTSTLSVARQELNTVITNGYMYAIGGYNAGFRSEVQAAKIKSDGTLDTWATVASLPGGREAPASATANGYIYTIGGFSGSIVNNVYYTSTARTQLGGSLDLIGLNGEGGGELSAGNTNIMGQLSVSGGANIAQSLAIGGDLSVGGSASFKNSVNSTTALQVQNANGQSLFNIDTTNTAVTINGGSSGAIRGWTTSANPMTSNARSEGAAVATNGYLYMVGGTTSNDANAQATVRYAKINNDGSNSTWTSNSVNLPQARVGHDVIAANGYIYVVGGRNTSGTAQTSIYYGKVNADGSISSWTTSSLSLPQARHGLRLVVNNGYMYVNGGENGGVGYRSSVLITKLNADGSLGSWRCQSSDVATECGGATNNNGNGLPNGRTGGTTFYANGYMYYIGGYAAGVSNDVYYAEVNNDGSTGAWTNQSSNKLPSARGGTIGGVMNGYVYIVGGWTGSTYSNSVFYAPLTNDGPIGAWTTEADTARLLPTAMNGNGGAIYNSYIYSVGGSNGSALTSVYYTSTARTQIAGGLDLVGLSGGTTTDGGTGGELTAGNTNILGNLDVRGTASFSQGMTIAGTLSVNDSAVFKSTTNTADAFQVQTASGAQLISVDTTNANILANGSFEGSNGTTGWAKYNGAETAFSTTTAAAYTGTQSLLVTNNAAADRGVKYNLTTTTLSSNSTYSFTFSAKVRTGDDAMNNALYAGRSENGSSDIGCSTVSGAMLTEEWTTFNCQFTTGTTSGTPYVYIKQNNATARTIYIDGVQLIRESFLANSSMEEALGASNWQAKGSPSNHLLSTDTYYDGAYSLRVQTNGTANQGTRQSKTLATNTTYTLSFYAVTGSGNWSTLSAGYSSDGSTDNTACLTNQTLDYNAGWSYFTCNFTTPASTSGTPYVYIKNSGATSNIMYLDAIRLTQGSSTPQLGGYREGTIALNGVISSATVFQNQTNSTTAFRIQNASGANIITADTANNRVLMGAATAATWGSAELVVKVAEIQTGLRVGDGTNGISFNDATAGKLRLSGTARNTRKVTLAPEYAGAVLDGSGSGTMTAAYDATQRTNYYKWTSTQVTAQTYDVVVTTAVPSDWSAWAASNAISISGWTSNITNSTGSLTVIGTNGTTDVNAASITPGSTSTWTTTNANLTSVNYTADGTMVIRLRVTASNSSSFQLGNVTLTYLSQF